MYTFSEEKATWWSVGMMCFCESKVVKLNSRRQESPERERQRELPNQTKRWHVCEAQNIVIKHRMFLGNMDKWLVDYHIQMSGKILNKNTNWGKKNSNVSEEIPPWQVKACYLVKGSCTQQNGCIMGFWTSDINLYIIIDCITDLSPYRHLES